MYVSCFTGSLPGKVKEPEFNPSPPPLVPFGNGRVGLPHMLKILGFGPGPQGQVPRSAQPDSITLLSGGNTVGSRRVCSSVFIPSGYKVATRFGAYVPLLATEKSWPF